MTDNKNRKPNRTKEQIIAEFDSKIAYHEKCIESLKVKKEEVLNPPVTPKQQIRLSLLRQRKKVLRLKRLLKNWVLLCK